MQSLPTGDPSVPLDAKASVLVQSVPIPADAIPVHGPDLATPEMKDVSVLLDSYKTIGFQATSLHRAIEIVQNMRKWTLSDEPVDPSDPNLPDEATRQSTKCTIFLGFTSNPMSSEILLYLVKNKHVSCLVTTAGGIEEDFIKCLDRMVEEQKEGKVWSPSEVIWRLGKKINNEESVYYWAWKNGIPVFCPALTDGSLGDMIYFHTYRTPELVIDIVQDIRKINDMALKAKKAGMIILGGGVCKHKIANTMLFQNGADYSVYIDTGQEFDGSDSGARPDEAVSWGKIKAGAQSVKVFTDAPLVFPLLVAATFARG